MLDLSFNSQTNKPRTPRGCQTAKAMRSAGLSLAWCWVRLHPLSFRRTWSRCSPHAGALLRKQWLELARAKFRWSLGCDCPGRPGNGSGRLAPPPTGQLRPGRRQLQRAARGPVARRRRESARPPPAARGGLGSPRPAQELAGRRPQGTRGRSPGLSPRTRRALPPARGQLGAASRRPRHLPDEVLGARSPVSTRRAKGDEGRGPPRSPGQPGATARAPLVLLSGAGDAVAPCLAGVQLGRGQAHGVQRAGGQLLRLRGGLPHTCCSHVSRLARGVRAPRNPPRVGWVLARLQGVPQPDRRRSLRFHPAAHLGSCPAPLWPLASPLPFMLDVPRDLCSRDTALHRTLQSWGVSGADSSIIQRGKRDPTDSAS